MVNDLEHEERKALGIHNIGLEHLQRGMSEDKGEKFLGLHKITKKISVKRRLRQNTSKVSASRERIFQKQRVKRSNGKGWWDVL